MEKYSSRSQMDARQWLVWGIALGSLLPEDYNLAVVATFVGQSLGRGDAAGVV